MEGDLIWLLFKKSKPFIGVFRRSILGVIRWVITTFRTFPCRVYAAMEESVRMWGWGINDLYDWIGAGICLAGVSVMLFAPRQ